MIYQVLEQGTEEDIWN